MNTNERDICKLYQATLLTTNMSVQFGYHCDSAAEQLLLWLGRSPWPQAAVQHPAMPLAMLELMPAHHPHIIFDTLGSSVYLLAKLVMQVRQYAGLTQLHLHATADMNYTQHSKKHWKPGHHKMLLTGMYHGLSHLPICMHSMLSSRYTTQKLGDFTCLGCEGPAAWQGAWRGRRTCRLGWLLPNSPPNAHEHHLITRLGTYSQHAYCFLTAGTSCRLL